jgi:hypothetical protein
MLLRCQNYQGKPNSTIEKHCKMCRRPFTPANNGAIYCGSECVFNNKYKNKQKELENIKIKLLKDNPNAEFASMVVREKCDYNIIWRQLEKLLNIKEHTD